MQHQGLLDPAECSVQGYLLLISPLLVADHADVGVVLRLLDLLVPAVPSVFWVEVAHLVLAASPQGS